MSSSLLEVLELSTGDIVLRRSDDSDSPPLVTIRFSEESIHHLGNARFEVAKAMIEAGIEMANDLSMKDDVDLLEMDVSTDETSAAITPPVVLH